MTPPLVLEVRELSPRLAVRVVRDDLMPGGTKARCLPQLLARSPAEEFVYASPVYGYAQVALAYACAALGRRATIFCAERKQLHARTLEAAQAGATIHAVPHGYLSVVAARAREYAARSSACLLPFGMDTPDMQEQLLRVALEVSAQLGEPPAEVWSVAGSGTLTRALQRCWPQARCYAVRVGAAAKTGRAHVFAAPEKFESDARQPPPFPSCSNYDAKAWRFVRERASDGALFWNVA